MMCVIQWSFFFLERILFFTWVATSIYVSHLIARDYKYNSTSQKKKNRRFECTLKEAEKNKGSEKSVSHSSLSLSIKQMMKNPLFIIWI